MDCAATLMAKSAWPKIVQRLWRGGLGVLKFARRQTRCKCGEHHASGFFYIDAGVAMDTIMNTLQGRRFDSSLPDGRLDAILHNRAHATMAAVALRCR